MPSRPKPVFFIAAISARCAKALVFSRSREIIQDLVSKIYLMSPPEESPAAEADDAPIVPDVLLVGLGLRLYERIQNINCKSGKAAMGVD